MKWVTLIAVSLLYGCNEHGPDVPTCFILEDLVTEYCIPFKKTDKEFTRPVIAGDYAFTPTERARIQRWIEQHKK